MSRKKMIEEMDGVTQTDVLKANIAVRKLINKVSTVINDFYKQNIFSEKNQVLIVGRALQSLMLTHLGFKKVMIENDIITEIDLEPKEEIVVAVVETDDDKINSIVKNWGKYNRMNNEDIDYLVNFVANVGRK